LQSLFRNNVSLICGKNGLIPVSMFPAPWLKVLGAFSCLVLSLCFGLLALHKSLQRSPTILGIANIAGGGVLLGVTFVHLLPEVQEGFASAEIDYPVGFALVLVGYVVLVLLEKVLFHHQHSHNPHQTTDEEPLQNSRDRDRNGESGFKKSSIVTPVLLMIALSIHSVLEGVVLGIQDSEASTLSLMIAILTHKPVETLFLGIIMAKEGVNLSTHIVLVTILSIVTPTGICIGLALDHLTDLSDEIIASFSAIAAGTFLYISTNEIISEEFHGATSASQRVIKFVSLLAGLGFIMAIRIGVSDDHGHSGHEGEHDHLIG